MRTLLLVGFLTLTQLMPKTDPNGIWVAPSGSEFEFTLVGSDIKVQIVPGSNASFLEYEMDLKGTDEPNTYQGNGRFKAKLQSGRECEFDTEWQIVIVAEDKIIGVASRIVPDPDTCDIVEVAEVPVELDRKQ